MMIRLVATGYNNNKIRSEFIVRSRIAELAMDALKQKLIPGKYILKLPFCPG